MHLLILRPNDHAILVGNGDLLPYFECLGSCTPESSETCQIVQRKLHANFHLNYLHHNAEYNNDTNYPRYFTHGIWVLEALLPQHPNHSPEAPDGYEWLPYGEASKIQPQADDEQEIGRSSAITTFLSKFSVSGLGSYIDRLRPYSCPGWYTRACAWFKEEVFEVAGEHVTNIVKLCAGTSGCTLQAETVHGTRFFMKEVGRGNNNELIIANSLHKRLPKHFRKLLSQNEEEGWMLMSDYGNPLTMEQCSLSRNRAFSSHVLLQWADIQTESIDLANELVKDGIPKVDGHEVLRQMEEMVQDDGWIEAQRFGLRHEGIILTEDEKYRERVIAHTRSVVGAIEKLELPLCLVHGDLNPVNVCSKGKKLTFFDFEATMISYPFLDALTFGLVCNDYRNVEQNTVEFYLKQWKCNNLANGEFESMNKFEVVLGTLCAYNNWRHAEDGERLLAHGEMSSPFSFG